MIDSESHNILRDTLFNVSKYDSYGLCDNLTAEQICLLRYWKSISTLRGVKKHHTNTTLEMSRLMSGILQHFEISLLAAIDSLDKKIDSVLESLKEDPVHNNYIEDFLRNYPCGGKSKNTYAYVWLHRSIKFGFRLLDSVVIRFCLANNHIPSCQNILRSLSEDQKAYLHDISDSDLFYQSYISTLGKFHSTLLRYTYRLSSYNIPSSDGLIRFIGISDGREHADHIIEMITDIISIFRESSLTKAIDHGTICKQHLSP
ncbi:hypothetical protein GJ496_003391 [Pomphorhynchus laevis]|nr:hypothetical protein GJ496_003391 [Pomphorhynchus laevis]